MHLKQFHKGTGVPATSTHRTIPEERLPMAPMKIQHPKIIIHKPEYVVNKPDMSGVQSQVSNAMPVEEKKERSLWDRWFGPEQNTSKVEKTPLEVPDALLQGKSSSYIRESQLQMDELYVMGPTPVLPASRNLYPKKNPGSLSPRGGDDVASVGFDDHQNPGWMPEPFQSNRSQLGEKPNIMNSETFKGMESDQEPLSRLSKPTFSKQLQRRGTSRDEAHFVDDWDDRLNLGVLDEDLHFLEDVDTNSMMVEPPVYQGLTVLQRKQSELPFVYNNEFKREFSKQIDDLAKKGNWSKSFDRHMEMISSQPIIEVTKPKQSTFMSPPVRSTAIRDSSISKENSPSKPRFQFGAFSELSLEVPPEINNLTGRQDNRVIGEQQIPVESPMSDPLSRKSTLTNIPVPIKYSDWRTST